MKMSQARKPVCIIPMLKAHHKQVRTANHLGWRVGSNMKRLTRIACCLLRSSTGLETELPCRLKCASSGRNAGQPRASRNDPASRDPTDCTKLHPRTLLARRAPSRLELGRDGIQEPPKCHCHGQDGDSQPQLTELSVLSLALKAHTSRMSSYVHRRGTLAPGGSVGRQPGSQH